MNTGHKEKMADDHKVTILLLQAVILPDKEISHGYGEPLKVTCL